MVGGGSVQKSFVEHELLNWTTFVEQRLYLEDSVDHGGDEKDSVSICQKGLSHVSPCIRNSNYVPKSISRIPKAFLRHMFASANDPVYEKRTNGRPFDNLLQLRAAKIRNVLGIPSLWNVAGFAAIPYEHLLRDMDSVLQEVSLAAKTDVAKRCPANAPFTKAPYRLPASFQEWIANHAEWSTEDLIGYKKRDVES